MFACLYAAGIAASPCACEFSPLTQQVDADTVVLDAAGLDRLIGAPPRIAAAIARRAASLGFNAQVAIAANPDAAIHAARAFSGVTVIPPGQEAARLGPIPIEALAPAPDILATLDCWGIRTFHDLAALPEIGLAERLGEEGIRLQKLARGALNRPLRPPSEELVFAEFADLEYPVTLLEPLSFVLSRLLHQLCGRLASRALAALALHLRLKLELRPDFTRDFHLPVPMRDPLTFLKLMQLDLNENPPGAPILAITITAEPSKPRSVQHGLFLPPTPEPERLEVTLARIESVVGAGNAGSAELLDTYRPDAFRIRKYSVLQGAGQRHAPRGRQLAFRVFRPALRAKVQAPGGRPSWISARGIHGKVHTMAGPWRSSGEWWTPRAWSRDEWDVELAAGPLYRVYRDVLTAVWFVDGSYD